MRDYRNIKAFQYADDLVLEIYKVTHHFPREEMYGLISQLRRAAVSCASNIAEGASRQHKKDYLHFLYIARGSLVETGYLISLAKRLGYLTSVEFRKLESLHVEASKTLFGLVVSVEKEARPFTKFLAFITSAMVLNSLRHFI